jgi:hypothetical protein
MAKYEGSDSRMIADVDCTADGQSLCEKNQVGGYPTIKWGDPADLQDYEGGRSYDDLEAFAEENLGPTCGPANLDLCDAKKKKKIEDLMAMGLEKVEAKMKKALDTVELEVPLMKKTIGYLNAKKEL